MQETPDATPADASHSGAVVSLLCVEVADHRCAVRVEHVVEIHLAVQLAPLPDAPDVVAGLVNRRGTPLPVLDLRRRLGLPTRPVQVDDRLVVLRLPDREVALLVDAAVDVLDVPATSLDEAVARTTGAILSQGVVVLDDGLLVVLDVPAFLSPSEAATLDEALQHALTVASA